MISCQNIQSDYGIKTRQALARQTLGFYLTFSSPSEQQTFTKCGTWYPGSQTHLVVRTSVKVTTAMDDHPPSPRWSPTIPRMLRHNPKYIHPHVQCWSPSFKRTVTHHPKDGHPPSQGWLPTIHRMITQHTKDGHAPFPGWLPTIPSRVTHNLKDGYPPSPRWSPTILLQVICHPQDRTHNHQNSHPKPLGWSSTIPRMETNLSLDADRPSPGRSPSILFL